MATYRFLESEPFFILTHEKSDQPIMFETAIEATRAAMERIKQQRRVSEPEPQETLPADILGLAAWREEKARERAETELIVKTGDFCPVKVEFKRKRKKVNGDQRTNDTHATAHHQRQERA